MALLVSGFYLAHSCCCVVCSGMPAYHGRHPAQQFSCRAVPCCAVLPAEVDAAYGQREAALEAYRQEQQGRQAEAKQQRSKARG